MSVLDLFRKHFHFSFFFSLFVVVSMQWIFSILLSHLEIDEI